MGRLRSRGQGSFVAVHQKHDLGDGEEADAQGERQLWDDVAFGEQKGNHRGEEAEVLEDAEVADVKDEAGDQDALPGRHLRSLHPTGKKPVGQNGGDEKDEVEGALLA